MARIKNEVETQLYYDIKRTNTRISAIAKKYGTESPVYKETIKGYQTDEFSKMTHKTKQGVLQLDYKISQKYANTNAPDNLPERYILRSQLSRTATLSQINKRFKESTTLTPDEIKKLSPEQLKTNIESMYRIRENFESIKNQFYELYTTGFTKKGDIQKLIPEMFKDPKKEEKKATTYEDLEMYTKKMEFFSKYSEYFNVSKRRFEFPKNKKPKNIPDWVKYTII